MLHGVWTAVMTLLLVLGTLQAIGKARRRQWDDAAASFLACSAAT
jgi:cbb3-type cytochrome oxidase subunit 3